MVQDEAVQVLLQNGVDVYAGYVNDKRNTDNAWVETRAVHFHCPRELGTMLPIHHQSKMTSFRPAIDVYASWIDANLELEPRYAEMARRRSSSPPALPTTATPIPLHSTPTTPHSIFTPPYPTYVLLTRHQPHSKLPCHHTAHLLRSP